MAAKRTSAEERLRAVVERGKRAGPAYTASPVRVCCAAALLETRHPRA